MTSETHFYKVVFPPMKKLVALIAVLAVVRAMPVCAFAAVEEQVPTEIKTSFIEPNYYPDYDVAEEAEETAPKTGDFSMLPQLALAAVSVGTLAFASKRAK